MVVDPAAARDRGHLESRVPLRLPRGVLVRRAVRRDPRLRARGHLREGADHRGSEAGTCPLEHGSPPLHPVTWVGGVLVVAALVAWPLGGWNTAAPSSREVPALAVGSTHRGEQFATRVVSVTVGTGGPRSFDTVKAGQEFLIVTADIENLTHETQPSTRLDDLLRISGIDARPQVLLVEDRSGQPDLVPGLRTRLLLYWTVSAADHRVGDRLPISIVDRTAYQSILFSGTGWRDPTVAAVTTPRLSAGPAADPDDAGFGS